MNPVAETTAFEWVERALAQPLVALLALEGAARDGGIAPNELRRRLCAALRGIELDDEGRTLGLRTEHVDYIQRALVALYDEVSLQSGSRCDYSESDDLLQREFMGTGDAGKIFFEDLDALLALESDDARRATIAVYTTCMSLGFRGVYAGHDLKGFEEKYEKARASCAAFEVAPAPPALRPEIHRTPPRTLGRIFALVMLGALVCTLATVASLYVSLRHESEIVADDLRLALDR
jgi:type IV/VI secretion system ImpK/VasF family protein